MKIQDVAKLADVSVSTVSRVINNSANVTSDKYERVLSVIKELNYKPNEVAISLNRKSSKMIGLIVPSIRNPFFSELTEVIEECIFENGFKLVLCSSGDDFDKESTYVETLLRSNVDGFIIITDDQEVNLKYKNIQKPIVFVDRYIRKNPSNDNTVISIRSDSYSGSILATTHLIECGCKKIAHIKGPEHFCLSEERFMGYKDTMQKYGMEIIYKNCNFSFENGLNTCEALFNVHPDIDGIFAANDMIALGVIRYCSVNGIEIPNNLQIVGFDNINILSLMTPSLTTIAQPISKIGSLSAKLILEAISGVKHKDTEYLLPVELIKRDTTKLEQFRK